MSESVPALEMSHVTKTFPGVRALQDVSFQVRPGTVHTLLGENGAGKSTLMNCAFGIHQPDEGEILVDGRAVHLTCPRDAMDQGIAMIHQELHPVSVRNVMENIWIGRVPCKTRLGIHWVDEKKMYQDTKDLFEDLDIHIDPRTIVQELSVSHCQMLEIARAVSMDARVIIMDEPTSSLSESEIEGLYTIVRRLTARGVAVVFISHKLDEIMAISDEVTIMRDGSVVGTWDIQEVNPKFMVEKMVGREITQMYPEKAHTPGQEVLLEGEHLTSAVEGSFSDVSFSVRRGEILGVAGLVGAQRTELMETLFGLRPLASGTIRLRGEEIHIRRPQDAIRRGLALVTEERRATGIVPVLSVEDNMVLANQTARTGQYRAVGPLLSEKKRAADSQQYVDSLHVKTPSLKTQIQYLSGGNQQKVMLGRWMLTEPELLILDEPTRGIDVGAKYEIYCLIEDLVKNGKSVIMISSYLPELLGMADRIMVMCEGRCTGVVDASTADESQIMHLSCAVGETPPTAQG